MQVLLSTYDSRGGVEPLLGLAVRPGELGVEVRMCAPPDCAERLAEAGVPLVPFGPPVRQLVHGTRPPSPADVPRRVAEVGIRFVSVSYCPIFLPSPRHRPQPLPGRPIPPDVTGPKVHRHRPPVALESVSRGTPPVAAEVMP